MKKIFGFILSAAMMLSVVSTNVLAAEEVTFTANNVTVNKDSATTVTVKIDLSNNPGLTAVNFKVGYDKDAFEYKASKKSEYKLSDDYGDEYDITLSKPNAALNPFVISAYSADPWYGDATFVSLVFYLKDGVKNGTYPITLTAGEYSTTDADSKAVPVTYVNGSITVEGTEAPALKGEQTINAAKFSTAGYEAPYVKVSLGSEFKNYFLPSGVKGDADVYGILKYNADEIKTGTFTLELCETGETSGKALSTVDAATGNVTAAQ